MRPSDRRRRPARLGAPARGKRDGRKSGHQEGTQATHGESA